MTLAPAGSFTPEECPTCGSSNPGLHPAVQHEGEVQPCGDDWHAQGFTCTEDMGSDPCGKPAVATRLDTDHGGYYPVCTIHSEAPHIPDAHIQLDGDRRTFTLTGTLPEGFRYAQARVRDERGLSPTDVWKEYSIALMTDHLLVVEEAEYDWDTGVIHLKGRWTQPLHGVSEAMARITGL